MEQLKTTYKKQLEIAKENNLNIISLMAAYEVKCIFGLDYEEFEEVCDLIKNIYLKTEYNTIYEICERVRHLLNFFTIEELKNDIKYTISQL